MNFVPQTEPMSAGTPAPADHPAFPLGEPARVLLATLSIAAAAVHLVMVPQHASLWLAEGLAFAAAGWFQLGSAVLVVARPSKKALQAVALANVAFVAVWMLSRTAGLPFGPDAGSAEAASVVDLTCAGIEIALVVAAAAFAARPRLGENLDSAKLIPASIVPIGVILLTTAVLASPGASGHAHGTAAPGDHHASDMAGMDHSKDSAGGDHAHPATPAAADRCDWAFNTVGFWNADPPAKEDPTMQHMHGSAAESAHPEAAGAGEGVGNQSGIQAWRPMTDAAECATFKADLDVMESMAKKYPTQQSAEDAGCKRTTIYVPGIGAHWLCVKNAVDGKLDPALPEMLLYGGNQPWSPLVGLSYYTFTKADAGWVSGQMPFHIHEALCFNKAGVVVGGDGTDKAACESAGGRSGGKTGFMGHYWPPSCSSPDGVFSADNPRLDAGVQAYNDDPKWDPANGGDPSVLRANPCAGSKVPVDTFGQPKTNASGETATR